MESHRPPWPGASLGLKVLPLEAMHSDMDILTRTLGLPQSIEVATVARDEDSAAVEATLAYTDGFVRDTVSSLMPMSWGARGGYTATFTDGVLEATSTMGFDGKPTGTVTAYTTDGVHELQLPPADQYTAMTDHVLAVRGEADNQITPASTIDALKLTLDIDRTLSR